MGRPINKKFIGNTSQSGQQIQATAWIPGAPGPALAYIQKQTANKSYKMTTTDGAYTGIVSLAQGAVALTQGQANVTVTPFGAYGSGAAATARMGAAGATITVSGSGALTADYNIDDTVTLVGGTNTAPAIFTVTGITAGNVLIANAGYNYTAGNNIQIGGAGWATNAVISVNSVNATGAITGFTLVNGGIRRTAAIDPISGSTTQGTSSNVDISGTSGTFNVRWGISNVAVSGAGVFSALPSAPVSTTTSGSGVGATLTPVWQVSNVVVSNGGTGFEGFAAVSFSAGNATAAATINATGSISSVTVTNGGTPATSIPSVSIGPGNSVQYAMEIRNQTVTTYDLNTFDWVMTGDTMTGSNQARIQSA